MTTTIMKKCNDINNNDNNDDDNNDDNNDGNKNGNNNNNSNDNINNRDDRDLGPGSCEMPDGRWGERSRVRLK